MRCVFCGGRVHRTNNDEAILEVVAKLKRAKADDIELGETSAAIKHAIRRLEHELAEEILFRLEIGWSG